MICSILTIRPVNRVSCKFFSHCTHTHAKPFESSLQHGSAVRHALLVAAPGSVGAKLTFLSAYGVMSFILHKLQRSGRKRYRTVKTTTECHGRDINAVRSNCASKAQFSKSHHPPNRPCRQFSENVHLPAISSQITTRVFFRNRSTPYCLHIHLKRIVYCNTLSI